jgi:hypothetical protein
MTYLETIQGPFRSPTQGWKPWSASAWTRSAVPEMATFSVVYSRNELLTAAVRKAIQDLRFEAARNGGPESKPIVDAVEIQCLFRPSR